MSYPYPWSIPSAEEARSRGRDRAYWPSAQLVQIATIAAKHLRNPDGILRIVDEVRQNLDDLPERIDKLVDAKSAKNPVMADKPKVSFIVSKLGNGNLRVSYLPEFPKDFGQKLSQYSHHAGYDPVNSLLFFRGFGVLWASQVDASPDPHTDLIIALQRNLVGAVVGVVRDAEARLGRHCTIVSRWHFIEDLSGNFQLLSPDEVEERTKAEVAAKKSEALYRADAPMRKRRELLERWNEKYGMDPRRIVALIEAFHPCRVPFDGRTEILVRHFGMKGSPSELQPGTVRSIKNTLTSLGEPMLEAAIPLEEARALAQRYLGRIRKRP